MRTSSCKAKGRRCAQEAKDTILKYYPELHERDVIITSSGVTGPDLMISPGHFDKFPFAVECKNQEAMNIWSSFNQAKQHAEKAEGAPLLIFRRNRSELMACVTFDFLVFMMSALHGYSETKLP